MRGWNTKELLQIIRRKRIKTWYLVVALVVAAGSSAYFLRRNNIEMLQLRSAVVQSDKVGGDTAEAIKILNAHVFSHMNTRIVRPIELVHTYNRTAEMAIEEASRGGDSSAYQDAIASCERRGVPLTSIAQCASDYIAQNVPDDLVKEVELPDKNLFTYTFVSPRWTPDLAGWSLLVTGVIVAWIILRQIERLAVSMVIRYRRKRTL